MTAKVPSKKLMSKYFGRKHKFDRSVLLFSEKEDVACPIEFSHPVYFSNNNPCPCCGESPKKALMLTKSLRL